MNPSVKGKEVRCTPTEFIQTAAKGHGAKIVRQEEDSKYGIIYEFLNATQARSFYETYFGTGKFVTVEVPYKKTIPSGMHMTIGPYPLLVNTGGKFDTHVCGSAKMIKGELIVSNSPRRPAASTDSVFVIKVREGFALENRLKIVKSEGEEKRESFVLSLTRTEDLIKEIVSRGGKVIFE